MRTCKPLLLQMLSPVNIANILRPRHGNQNGFVNLLCSSSLERNYYYVSSCPPSASFLSTSNSDNSISPHQNNVSVISNMCPPLLKDCRRNLSTTSSALIHGQKQLASEILQRQNVAGLSSNQQQRRCFWGWLNSIFNRVDENRIKEVGPDRACAEWLLRCGAGVKWDKSSDDEWIRDYNSLPVGSYRTLKIVAIDATDSAVMHIGFPHFKGLQTVRKAVFHRCSYMEDEAVRSIGYLKDTLEDLQISSCGNVTDEGILTLVQMKKLKRLQLWDFLEVRDRKHCLSVLKEALPSCKIHFPFARESDRDPADSSEKANRNKK